MTNYKSKRTLRGGWWAYPILLVILTNASRAMEIEKFDKMAHEDRKEYVIELIEGAQKVLRDEGHADLPEKVAELFTTNAPRVIFPLVCQCSKSLWLKHESPT